MKFTKECSCLYSFPPNKIQSLICYMNKSSITSAHKWVRDRGKFHVLYILHTKTFIARVMIAWVLRPLFCLGTCI